jgi:hypothetical protein
MYIAALTVSVTILSLIIRYPNRTSIKTRSIRFVCYDDTFFFDTTAPIGPWPTSMKLSVNSTLVQCFLVLPIVLSFLFFKTQRFGDWILSPSSGKTVSGGTSSVDSAQLIKFYLKTERDFERSDLDRFGVATLICSSGTEENHRDLSDVSRCPGS